MVPLLAASRSSKSESSRLSRNQLHLSCPIPVLTVRKDLRRCLNVPQDNGTTRHVFKPTVKMDAMEFMETIRGHSGSGLSRRHHKKQCGCCKRNNGNDAAQVLQRPPVTGHLVPTAHFWPREVLFLFTSAHRLRIRPDQSRPEMRIVIVWKLVI
jgi:hypothetical protein